MATATEMVCERVTELHTEEHWQEALGRFLDSRDTQATEALYFGIRRLALRAAHGGNWCERETFANEAPADVLFVRESTGNCRLDLYKRDLPFLPWLRTVLANLWKAYLREARRAIVNSELLSQVEPAASRAARSGRLDLPALTENGYFTVEVVSRLLAATNLQRLVCFLAVTGLHEYFPGWLDLVAAYERDLAVLLPRPFPSLAVELNDTPRTRTGLLAREMGYRANNTLTQSCRRACLDLRAAFPELARMLVPDAVTPPDLRDRS